MFTPQEIQDRSSNLEKAVFGGYSMASVEELLEPLAQDYAALYKENAVLKSKMKVLVERLEEYRKSEDGINRALLAAQKTADEVVGEAERKSAKLIAEAEGSLQNRRTALEAEVTVEKERVAAEQRRVNQAKKSALAFIADMEARIQEQLKALERIKTMDLSVSEPITPEPPKPAEAPKEPEPQAPKAAQIQEEPPAEAPKEPELSELFAEEPEDSGDAEGSDDTMAREIEENISRIFAEAAKAAGSTQEKAPAE